MDVLTPRAEKASASKAGGPTTSRETEKEIL